MFAKNNLLSALALVFAVTCIGITIVNAQDCNRYYTVQPDDTCDGIAAANNAPTYQIETVNKAVIDSECDNLKIGEILCLGIKNEDCSTVHVVQTGDSCPTIAASANITYTAFMSENPNVNENCNNIYPGEVLCVAPVTNTTPAKTPIRK